MKIVLMDFWSIEKPTSRASRAAPTGAVADATSLSTMVTMAALQVVTANFATAAGATVRGNGR